MSTKVLTEESPAKVMGLLGVALCSMAFMLGVSLTNASFEGTEIALADPFAPEKVVALVDNVAAGYSEFLAVNLIQPLSADYEIYADNLAWLFEESGMQYALGLENVNTDYVAQEQQGQVAGAYTSNYQSSPGAVSVDTLTKLLGF
jgi:hypothetical protein